MANERPKAEFAKCERKLAKMEDVKKEGIKVGVLEIVSCAIVVKPHIVKPC